ncbi:type I-B CRISPR-associated protein Cas7/Cst2/DevR [Hippea sp. KM1]|uniref:type I-B CRISPR-associated protein Cas7/Cst2/DevR n=1 Tax=Hippea sp. KM1 TaxID=944481 RepID=UPI0004B731EB|nr:type I-B CRISPR-associated protein Cas7/Cst2/DevR [Hippea sp. KM1]
MINLKPQGLTVSLIFEAMSLNYGEGVGNISELKKLSRSGEFLSYESRQALRYDVYRMLKEQFGIDSDREDPLTAEQDVVQFKSEANIRDYIEADLFGYMKTAKSKSSLTRPAVVRITPAISLEPMLSDIEFGTNLNFAQRTGANPNPFQFEHHLSLYSYTVTIELDRVGEDPNDVISIEPEEKARRVNMVLDVLKVLNRNIKGRTENLNPLFAIGGVYNVKNPFFMGRLRVRYNRETRKHILETPIIESALEMSFGGENIKDRTHIGIVKGFWENEEEIRKLVSEGNYHNINDFLRP